MNLIERIVIDGLWGDKSVNLPLHKDVNFLIGPNGSGKTTIINLVVAALTADLTALTKIPFETIRIDLVPYPKGQARPSIEVRARQQPTASGSFTFEWVLKSAKGAEPEPFLVEETPHLVQTRFARRRVGVVQSSDTFRLRHRLSEFLNLTWLSVHRAQPFRNAEADESFDSTVDTKLNDLSDLLVRYFSELDQANSVEVRKFQETVFLSLLARENMRVNVSSVSPTDLPTEQRALLDIYDQLRVPATVFKRPVETHFRLVTEASTRLVGTSGEFSWDDIAALVLSDRTHAIVKEWNILRERQAAISEPQVRFLTVVNSLVRGKSFSIGATNELEATLADGAALPLQVLSSGEKQMLIILGEALLQRSQPTIYIADEPELSLHIEWQQSLVQNVLGLNPAAQILFATHSPDVVSTYGSCAVDAEDVIQ
ncbi:MAG: AAA family ATPase [Coriobacteriia bacterium]|nr:AAA family ATPase [Coriobacteriia bacterium]